MGKLLKFLHTDVRAYDLKMPNEGSELKLTKRLLARDGGRGKVKVRSSRTNIVVFGL